MSPRPRIVVSGIGIVSAAGCTPEQVAQSFSLGQHCLKPVAKGQDPVRDGSYVGEPDGFDCELPPLQRKTVDPGSQLALQAARQALKQTHGIDLQRTGILIGASGAQQYHHRKFFTYNKQSGEQSYTANLRTTMFMVRNTLSFQAEWLAKTLHLGGGSFAFASASMSSLLALSHAMDLLELGHGDAMLVGGGETHTRLNAMGLDMLGVSASGPVQPFGENDGISFGSGAAFVVLERRDDCLRRGGKPLLELVSASVCADAYDELAGDPSGRGLAQAIRKVLDRGNARKVAWIRASGIGLRAQDNAEMHALQASFPEGVPPVTSTEPYFGHVNGVSPVLGVVAGTIAMTSGAAPALPQMDDAGLPFPLLKSGDLPSGDWLLNAVAFGGNNGALLCGSPAEVGRVAPQLQPCAIDIIGAGAMSCFGAGVPALLDGLQRTEALTSLSVQQPAPRIAGVDFKRLDLLAQWVMVAVAEAITDAGLPMRGGSRIGLLVGFAYGAPAPMERVMTSLAKGQFGAGQSRDLLAAGRFSILAKIARTFGLQGYCAATAPGVGGGMQLLGHAVELLRAHEEMDALIVVAADQRTAFIDALMGSLHKFLKVRGLQVPPIGEGSVALVLARRNRQGIAKWGALSGVAFGSCHEAKMPALTCGADRLMRATLAAFPAQSPAMLVTASLGARHDLSPERLAFDILCSGVAQVDMSERVGLVPISGGLFGALHAAHRLAGSGKTALLGGSTTRGAQTSLLLHCERGAR